MLDWLLVERLRAASSEYASVMPNWMRELFEAIRWYVRRGWRRDECLPDETLVARLQELDAAIRHALCRYYVFGESGEVIARSMGLTAEQFHQQRALARDFVLSRGKN
ncbi:MAG: hypothetical protein ABI759_15560 [Candidatus Solibacter sp.]